MAQTGDKKLEFVFSMKGGRGDSSYANNSQAQAIHARAMLHHLEETLDGVKIDTPEVPFAVADLGCGSGTNTIDTVDFIVKHMIKRYEALGYDPPEFSAFFSDLPSNDFNTLFQLLPPSLPHDGGSKEEHLAAGSHRFYFAAGVAGSFYRRLFPARSIDIFYSAFSLHWLPQVPDIVLDKESTAYNKGRVFIDGANESTTDAYRNLFESGLSSFLRSRSQEIKQGGSMFLVLLGRTSVDPADQGGPGILFGTHFQDAWEDLVQQGLISEEQRDDFNIPLYAPSLQDFEEVVKADGSFIINKLEVVKGGSPLVVNDPNNADEVAQALVNNCRSVSGVLVDAHIGDQLGEELFSRVEKRAASRAEELLEQLQFFHIVASLSLA
ncbi:Indole-3-acetate O-methyltransferase 1 [Sarracenia purpurea var. burkii]